MSAKYFNTYVSQYMYQPHYRIFEEKNIKILEELEIISKSTIYAIVKTSKVKFIPSSFEMTTNYCVEGKLLVDGKQYNVIFNMAKYWFDGESDLSKGLKSRFKTINEFVDYALSDFIAIDGSNVSNSEKYRRLAQVKPDSTEEQLNVRCPIASGMNNGEPVDANLFVYQLINHYDMDLLSKLEICYIGKSNRSTFKRLKNHEKWGPILSSKHNEHFDYFAYFFVIDEATIYKLNANKNHLVLRTWSKLPNGVITSICEATLINYFKPDFNKEFVNTDILNVKVVKDWLVAKGFDAIMTEVELEGLMGQLGTKLKPYSGRHVFEISITP
ncbi:hypothetical protein HWQ46_25795 [Shewanella sp. D64]|uniref:hypothetical protein n=1 Tax=unclassified Shewanella TaxID=196818 RepID=UPI0022BA4935|nr:MULTISPECIES: hypothetical protein [unclassified Shewanella]MEC4728931.1 hypothetical protein [Shewanella sp. D64]MEC4740864.1 hypothetical protein [Shewanella sp. E94]WBJ96705.1 hypothetical protein HWQ47_06210 [Shewanella sp. MTB7]